MNVDLAVYEALAKQTLQRVFAEEDSNSLHQWLVEQLSRIGGAAEGENPLMTWEESFDYYESVLDRLAYNAQLPADQIAVKDWPWASWNNFIDPMEPGMLAVLSAGDGMGKTIYAEEIAEHWAKRRNRVVFVHYELNREIMLHRRMARHSSITYRELRSGRLSPDLRQRVRDVRARLLTWEGNISYLHTPGWSMDKTGMELRKLKAEGRCDVVVLDYLEKNAASRRQIQLFGQNLYQREADNVEQIKTFAEASETPVLMLAQMSKAGKKLGIDDLDRTGMRGAGEKSEKANLVVLLSRERMDEGYSPTVDVRVDKNTVGRTGQFRQYMEAEYFRVADLVREPL